MDRVQGLLQQRGFCMISSELDSCGFGMKECEVVAVEESAVTRASQRPKHLFEVGPFNFNGPWKRPRTLWKACEV